MRGKSPRTSAVILAGLVLLLAVGFGVIPGWSGQPHDETPTTTSVTTTEPSRTEVRPVVVFDSDSPFLVEGDTNASEDVFVRDLSTGTTERVSVSSTREQAATRAPSGSWSGTLSADGRYVAFFSDASNLVPDDTNGEGDIFVRDRVAGTTERVSVSTEGAQADGESFELAISADGRYVAFTSFASNLVPDDTNGGDDVFVHDRIDGTTERVSITDGEEQAELGHGGSYSPSLSADGRYVTFVSDAANLVADDWNGERDVFVRDRADGRTESVSLSSDGELATGESESARISADGTFVAFRSEASNLVPGDTNEAFDLFLRDRAEETTERISVGSDGTQGDDDLAYWLGACLSADGRFVAFGSDASNLVPADTNRASDVFLRDRVEGTTERISVSTGRTQGNGESFNGALSADGRYVTFVSEASNLVPGDRNRAEDVFVRDLIARTTERVSVPLRRASAGVLALEPDPPEAGKTFAAHMPVFVGDAPAGSAKIACTATVAGNALQVAGSSYRSGAARCSWSLPVTTTGSVVGNVRATTGAGSVSRSFRARIQAAGPRVEITSFARNGISPTGITVGPDRALWFTSGNSIGRITTEGAMTLFEDPKITGAEGIAAGPDGALWFTNGDSIGRITTRGVVSIFRSKTIEYLGAGITAGPDGALWFTMYSEEAMYNGDPKDSGIGRTTTGGKVTVYRNGSIDGPGGITAGPDRALWFTMYNYKAPYAGIGRITPRGSITAWHLSTGEIGGTGPSLAITTGPDRAVWFAHPNLDLDSVGRITTSGVVTVYRHRSIDSPYGLTVGRDGALWFTNGNSIGRITTRGAVTAYRDRSIRGAAGITLGPDGAIWFANSDGSSIGRLRILPAR